MSDQILQGNTNFLQIQGESAKGVWLKIQIGASETERLYALVDRAGGDQPFRTQFDLAADGTQYILTAGKGLGNYTFTLMEGPVSLCSGGTLNTFANKYGNLETYNERKLLVTIPLTPEDSGTFSTGSCALFQGVINGASTTTVRTDEGQLMIYTTISAQGVWKS